jgi:integrase
MFSMPKRLAPYLSHERTRHGRSVWYFRKNGKRIRLKPEYGTPEFVAAYQAALAGAPQFIETGARRKAAAGTLAWLIERYRETTAWSDLSLATRRNRENHFEQVIKAAGAQPIHRITSEVIIAGRDRRAATPAQARNFLDAMRGLFKWAKDSKHVTVDPTAGVKNPKRRKGPGFPMWTEEDAAAYDQRWPLGTRERVWRDVLFYTGLRRGDAVRVGRQHVSQVTKPDGSTAKAIVLRTEKSQGEMVVTIPILPVLQRTLDAGPIGELAFICGKGGKPLTKESFGNAFKDACKAAGLDNRSAHGCRKIAATRAAHHAATVPELNAIFGWKGTAMASLYTEAAERQRLSLGAMAKVQSDADQNETTTSIVAPSHEVRQIMKKTK